MGKNRTLLFTCRTDEEALRIIDNEVLKRIGNEKGSLVWNNREAIWWPEQLGDVGEGAELFPFPMAIEALHARHRLRTLRFRGKLESPHPGGVFDAVLEFVDVDGEWKLRSVVMEKER